jgi:(E)-4-hydroxy-3-methylbut-2-enyl-diphosphate synthase
MNVVTGTTTDFTSDVLRDVSSIPGVVLIVRGVSDRPYREFRDLFRRMDDVGVHMPIIVSATFDSDDLDADLMHACTDVGSILADGRGDGVMISVGVPSINVQERLAFSTRLSFGILQATRLRMSKTEYISCPSCGRTLFDLQETTSLIRSVTDHLKGVKIGIMGCIVNGPGEMADADYGYVGSGPERITLYRGQEIVKRNVPTSEAVDELIAIIRSDDRWIDKG